MPEEFNPLQANMIPDLSRKDQATGFVAVSFLFVCVCTLSSVFRGSNRSHTDIFGHWGKYILKSSLWYTTKSLEMPSNASKDEQNMFLFIWLAMFGITDECWTLFILRHTFLFLLRKESVVWPLSLFKKPIEKKWRQRGYFFILFKWNTWIWTSITCVNVRLLSFSVSSPVFI